MKNLFLKKSSIPGFFWYHSDINRMCSTRICWSGVLPGHKYGFIGGVWHGFIAPFDFIGMLFNEKITMYAQNNNGGLYALDFF